MTYRSWTERREIIKAIIAESEPKPLAEFSLSASEEIFFRARSERAVRRLAEETSAFKAYYALPTARPFLLVVTISAAVILSAILGGAYVFVMTRNNPAYPIFAALISLSVVALGWAVAGWITHRNTVRQNTNNMLFARFSQAPIGEAMHRFNKQFGPELVPTIDRPTLLQCRSSESDDDRKAGESVLFLLNYFELICAGVIAGDLDGTIIKNNVRGLICGYYDKCEPHIQEANRRNPRVYEHLIKVRTAYREP